jgi:hypothetical protein
MRPIRGYLYSKDAFGDWSCTPFREFEPLEEATQNALKNGHAAAVVHIGIWRPDTKDIVDLANSYPNRVLLSPSAIAGIDPNYKVSRLPIGKIDSLDFYLALEGFGYSIDDPFNADINEEALALPKINNEQESTKHNEPKEWVKELIRIEANWTEVLQQVDIWNEASYISNEGFLSPNERLQIGLNRYVLLTGGEPKRDTFFDNIHACPPWLTRADIRIANLTVRSTNVFNSQNIKYVADIAAFKIKGLLKLPNMGLKSINEASNAIIDLFLKGTPLNNEVKLNNNKKFEIDFENISFRKLNLEQSDTNKFPDIFEVASYKNIFEGINSVSKFLSEEDSLIWRAKLGLGQSPLNLAEIAEKINKSRERVRQLEGSIYKKLRDHPFWKDLRNKVAVHLEGRTSPLLLDGISAVDPWFDGSEKLNHALKDVSANIKILNFSIIYIDDSPIITRINQGTWRELLDDAKLLIKSLAEQSLSEEIVKVQIQSLLSGIGNDLKDTLWEKTSPLGIWIKDQSGLKKLVGFGQTSSSLALAILNASETAIRCEEVFRRLEEVYPGENNFQSIKNAIHENSYLLGRGTYGLRKHCPLNDDELITIRTEVENIFAGIEETKQWHSDEIIDELEKSGFDFAGRLDKYNIVFALEKSESISYLGRMVWTSKDHRRLSPESRLDVRQAVISILENAGQPLSSIEIKSRLNSERGVNVHFQIFPNKPLIRIRPGIWGLYPRDVNIEDAEKKVYQLLAELSTRQEGLHTSEVAKFLNIANEDDVSLIVCLGIDLGLKVDKGQYCYLEAWGNSRRASIIGTIEKTLESHPEGLTLSKLHSIVEKQTKRSIQRAQVSTMLQNIDAEFDASTMFWKLSEKLSDEDFSATN